MNFHYFQKVKHPPKPCRNYAGSKSMGFDMNRVLAWHMTHMHRFPPSGCLTYAAANTSTTAGYMKTCTRLTQTYVIDICNAQIAKQMYYLYLLHWSRPHCVPSSTEVRCLFANHSHWLSGFNQRHKLNAFKKIFKKRDTSTPTAAPDGRQKPNSTS